MTSTRMYRRRKVRKVAFALAMADAIEYRIAKHFLLPMLHIVLMLGSALMFTGGFAMNAAAQHSHVAVFNDGVSPTSMMSGNLPQAYLSVYYNRVFYENLKQNTVKYRLTTRETMPEKSGQIYRGFMEPLLTANTTQQTEGTVGTGLSITTNFQDYVLGQWADYINISDKAMVTSIMNDMVQLRKEMAYRAALSLDDLVTAMFDYLITLDSKTNSQSATVSPYSFTKAMIEQAPFSLEGQNVLPLEGGYWGGAIHPFFVGDMIALDTGNNSIVDILKRTPEGMMKLEELPGEDDEYKLIEILGVKWMKTTNVTQTVNYLSSGTTALRTYLAGKDAVISVKLNRPDRTDIDDGNYKNMTLWMGEYAKGQVADPAGVIAGGTSYNFIAAFGPPPDVTSRARCWDAVPQTS